jgi:hypothetical protein
MFPNFALPSPSCQKQCERYQQETPFCSHEARKLPIQSSQLFSTVSLTLLVYSFLLSLYKFDASTFAGDPVFGSFSRLEPKLLY